MASSSKVGDLVWAKMKGFPAWPGKVIEPKVDLKKQPKKNQHFVFFFGSENYAWIHEDNIWPYCDFKSRFLLTTRIPKGYKEAVEAIEDNVKNLPKQTSYKVSELPSIEEELSQIFPSRSPQKEKDCQSSKKRKSSANLDPDYKSKASVPKERRSSTSKRKSEKMQKDRVEERNKKDIQEDKSVRKVSSLKTDDTEIIRTHNGRPARRSSRSTSSTSVSAQPTDEVKAEELNISDEVEGKQVVPYEEWVASEESVAQVDVHVAAGDIKVSDNQLSSDSIAQNEPIDSPNDAVDTNQIITTQINDIVVENETSLKESKDIQEENKNNDTATESSEQKPDNVFDRVGFASVFSEPSAEEMFDEMIRSTTPNTPLKANDSIKSHPSEDSLLQGKPENTEPDGESKSDTNTNAEPMPVFKLSSVDLKDIKPKTPVSSITSKKPTPKRSSSPVNTPVSKKSRVLEKNTSKAATTPKLTATPKVTTPKQYTKPVGNIKAVAASSSEGKPLAGISADACPAVGEAPPKTIIATPAKIGFLGLGIMGQGMVYNLLKSGHEVTVWNRTASKCREFVKEGALKGNSPAEVVTLCDITFSCVSDPTALKDLVFGNGGVLQGIGPKKSFVDMSTVDVETIIDIHEAVIARGGRFLEAPVIGSKTPAQSGELIVLSAGDISLHEDCFSCFQAIGKKTLYLGDIGNAARMKLVANMLTGVVTAGLAECMALAEKIGLDQAELFRVLMLSEVASPLIDMKGSAIMTSKFETNFPLQHQQKDLRLAIDMADSVDQPMYVISAANELFKKAKAKGYGEHDMSAVYRAADM